MGDFFRFPHIPHLAWLAAGEPRDDKVLSPGEAQVLLSADVVVEEKLDGANLGFSTAPAGDLRVQNRGQYLIAPHAGQFARLPAWLAQHGEALRWALTSNKILFGEWCAARHSLDYPALPDWLLVFDVYDCDAGRFWSSPRRNALAASLGLASVPQVACGKTTVAALTRLIDATSSRYRNGPMEGVVVRRDSTEWCDVRAKLVRANFTQGIETHWRKRAIKWNRLDPNSQTRF